MTFAPTQTEALQEDLFGKQPTQPKKIVNVASVKQLSPFRYPGGKTWLVPEVRQWLKSQKEKPAEFIEVFAGGGITGLTVANEQLADHVTLIELDPDVSAVWKTILENGEWLAKRILDFDLTMENVTEIISSSPKNTEDHGFQTILRNRVCHGGILAPGSGLLKNGENGKGIASRWYPETLAKRIRNIVSFKDRISFIEGDGLKYMEETAHRTDVTYFIDPPYTAPGKRAGRRLYRYSEIDHERLFDITNSVSGNFMMTYDDADSVKDMAHRREFSVRKVPMKGTHHRKMFELLITPT